MEELPWEHQKVLLWPEGVMGKDNAPLGLLPTRQLIREHEVAVEGTILTVQTDTRSLFIPLSLNKTTHIVFFFFLKKESTDNTL